ncbi:SCO6880 family protein [Arthrobacter sp. D2-10]
MAPTEAETTDVRPRVYGNYRVPTSKGLAGLSTAGTIVLVLGVIGGVLLMMLNMWAAALLFEALIAMVLLLSMHKNKHGRTLMERIFRRFGWMNAQYTGANTYRAGPVSRVPGGTTTLPGISARSTISEHTDAYGRPFALLHVPQRNHYTVVLGSEPDGGGMVDQEQINRWVDRWSHWLGILTDEPGLIAASVTIETAPDSGFRLARKVESRIDPNAPAFARAVIQETVAALPTGATVTRAYIAVTFRAALRTGGRIRKADEVANDLAARLPNITASLSNTGAGVATPLTAQELCEVIRVAYDPAEAVLFDRAHAEGKAPLLNWSEVGPQAADTFWDSYHHNNAWSKSWAMSVPPRSTVQANVLQALVAPSPEVVRKRVTMLYRPIDAARAAQLVENDVNTATFNASSRNRATSRDTRETRAARATAEEEADGAGLLNFAMIVTATVRSKQDLPEAEAAIENLGASARIRLEEAYGAQDSTFAAGLPLGIVIPDHLALPKTVRDAL